jgi:sec-independent protein translocase protein TatA
VFSRFDTKHQKATIVGLPPQAEGRNMRVGPLGIPEIAIIVVVILLIFGAKRLPEIGTSMGKGIRTFKTALMGDDEKDEALRGKDDSNS